jgi:hypothetical protein
MTQLLGICGIDCAACPALIAWRTNDDELRRKTAAEWTKAYGHEMPPESINCTGCGTETGPHVGYCESMCEIRKCGRAKGVTNCAACADFACDKLTAFWKMAPQAEANLRALRPGN